MNDSNDEKLIDELANLLNETAEAHHKAFAATEGEDPDWPLWYAEYLFEKLKKMLNATFTKSELIYLLVLADKKNGVVAPGAYWPRFCKIHHKLLQLGRNIVLVIQIHYMKPNLRPDPFSFS